MAASASAVRIFPRARRNLAIGQFSLDGNLYAGLSGKLAQRCGEGLSLQFQVDRVSETPRH